MPCSTQPYSSYPEARFLPIRSVRVDGECGEHEEIGLAKPVSLANGTASESSRTCPKNLLSNPYLFVLAIASKCLSSPGD
ncbi:hypothetical protein ACTXT7_003279 [Hymenolepis weldensis]